MRVAFIIIASVVFGLIILFLALKIVFGSVRKNLLNKINQRFDQSQIIKLALNANFFGQKSKGMKQIRGNGALVLTKDELYFLLALPKQEIAIPTKKISSVSIKKSHLGKTVLYPLIYVEYESVKGKDAIAWAAQEPDKWKAAIEDILASKNQL